MQANMYLLLVMTISLIVALSDGRDLTSEPGHLKPFGEGRPSQPLEEVEGFPTPEDFFENYVKPLKPLKMTNAAKLSPAFLLWTDDYFLHREEPADHTITVETVKKESRQQNVLAMSFKEFVSNYNNTDNYMVNGVPPFIQHDVVVPCPLQCKGLVEENFVDNVMWFSSGGTKSVVHTDSVDNINCLFRGNKTLIMVDPEKHSKNVDLDRPEGSYSMMDVDQVDYTKYPGMADVDFYHVNLTAGDCLYIPYLWIHQVRSYGSNLAVNVWWRHHLTVNLDYSQCNRQCDPNLTLQDAIFTGFDGLSFDPSQIRDHLLMSLGSEDRLTFQRLAKSMFGPEMRLENAKEVFSKLHEIYQLLDMDSDGIVTRDELDTIPNKELAEVGLLFTHIDDMVAGTVEGEGEEIEDEEEEKVTLDQGQDSSHDEL